MFACLLLYQTRSGEAMPPFYIRHHCKILAFYCRAMTMCCITFCLALLYSLLANPKVSAFSIICAGSDVQYRHVIQEIFSVDCNSPTIPQFVLWWDAISLKKAKFGLCLTLCFCLFLLRPVLLPFHGISEFYQRNKFKTCDIFLTCIYINDFLTVY